MLQSYSLFEAEKELNPVSLESDHDFTVEEVLWTTMDGKNNDLYKQIVYKVIRNPKHLISHIQRIYFTYNQRLDEPLYAALVDLLLALDGKGKQLGKRMFSLTRSVLTDQQNKTLTNYLKNQNTSLLTANKFTVLTKGIVEPDFLLIDK